MKSILTILFLAFVLGMTSMRHTSEPAPVKESKETSSTSLRTANPRASQIELSSYK